MAKAAKKQAAVSIVKAAEAEIAEASGGEETIDPKTGEILQLDNSFLKRGAETMARAFEKATTWEKEASDFWKPTKPGEQLVGAYVGARKGKKYLVHHVLVPHPKTGKPFMTRINGSVVLTKELLKRDVDPMDPATYVPIRITYVSTGKTDAGQKLHDFCVEWGK